MMKKKISVMTPCYNEELNVENIYQAIKETFAKQDKYDYEHIFIDNCSKDRTVEILRGIAQKDKNVKLILNYKNFGQANSPFYAILQCYGDAVVVFACDLQDPPDLILEFIKKWEQGHDIVIGVKNNAQESFFINSLRKLFYFIMSKISEKDHIDNFSGYGLYDQSFVQVLRKLDIAYPYFRGLVAEYSRNRCEIAYTQSKRRKGKSSNNLYTLYEIAMLGIVNQSKLPLRLASFIGFIVAGLSLAVSIGYFVYKILYWDQFELGMAPLVIGLFFFSAIQLAFVGILGEYISLIFTEVKKDPLVIEKERVNFTDSEIEQAKKSISVAREKHLT